MAFFSVVIPLFNKALHIEETLQCVINQSLDDFEVIIVDDGSTDASVSVVKKFNDQRIKLIQQENKGAPHARNRGINQASSTYIALLDADDLWEPNHLSELQKTILKFRSADLFCNAYALKLSNNFTHNACFNLASCQQISMIEDYFEASYIHPIAWTSAVAFSKSSFLKLGGFDTQILSGQDLDLWIKYGLHCKIAFNPVVTACYDKTVSDSLSKENHRLQKYALFNRFVHEENNHKTLKKYLDLNRYSVAIHCKYHNDQSTLKLLKSAISSSSLNFKQRLLLNAPNIVVRNFKQFQGYLISKKIYLTAFN